MTLTEALLCLALNVYFEARGEPLIGQYAVAHVTLNRVRDNNSSICEEVYKPGQFTWTKKKRRIPNENDSSWKKSKQVAKSVLSVRDPTQGSLYFHRSKVKQKGKIKIGSHVFYKK